MPWEVQILDAFGEPKVNEQHSFRTALRAAIKRAEEFRWEVLLPALVEKAMKESR